jgi:hypothetical protein
MYEGADNGMYRLYRRPVLASPFLVRKAIYRYQKSQALATKNEVLVSVPWYKWMFNGSRDRSFDVLRQMQKDCDDNGCKLTVLMLHAGCAYQNGKYELADMYDQIAAMLKQASIRALDPRDLFATRVKECIDCTDHLTFEGNRVLTQYLAQQLASPTTRPAGAP